MEMSAEYIVVFEPDPDGGWVASVPDLAGCFADGNTYEEAEVSIRVAIGLWIETAKAKGWRIPKPMAKTTRVAI
jgi:predicted RNase H-like HicB family nuclease